MRNIIITLITLCVSFNILAKQNDNYVCEKIISEKNNLSQSTEKLPEIIQIVYDQKKNKLLGFLWDGTSMTKLFRAVDFTSKAKILEFWRVGYGFSLSEDDILNGIYFELYSGDLVAHLYKQFVPGVDYQCYKI